MLKIGWPVRYLAALRGKVPIIRYDSKHGVVTDHFISIYLAIVALGAGAGQENSARFSEIQNCLGNGVFGLLSFFMPVLLRYCSRFFSVHLASFLTKELILAFLDVRWFLILDPTGYAAYILGLIYFQAQDKLAFPLVLGVYFGIGVSSGLP